MSGVSRPAAHPAPSTTSSPSSAPSSRTIPTARATSSPSAAPATAGRERIGGTRRRTDRRADRVAGLEGQLVAELVDHAAAVELVDGRLEPVVGAARQLEAEERHRQREALLGGRLDAGELAQPLV